MHPLQKECQRLVEAGLPGAFVYLADPDGKSRFYTSGFADLTTRQPMSPDLHFPISSTTKTFTAVVLLQLISEGKLALSDTLDRWLPDLPVPNADSLTIEHLLRMRSGLFDFESDPSLSGIVDTHRRPYTLDEVIHLSLKHPARFPPGTRYDYCNTNFCLLERVIERITRHGLAVELAQKIFYPAGMAKSIYPDEGDLALPEPYIRGYEYHRDKWEECDHIFFGRGDGALISTAIDLGKFYQALLFKKTLLPHDLLRQMKMVIHDRPPASTMYGLGLMASSLPCGTVWGHIGGTFGYANLSYLQCETGRFVIFMINGSYNFRSSILLDRAIRAEAFTSNIDG